MPPIPSPILAPTSAPAGPPEAASEASSSLELAERLRSVGSFSECAVEALRFGYDHPAERARGFERAALCLSLAGRHDDARRLMLALPSEGAALDGPGRLRICLAEVFLLELGAPACLSLESGAPPDRFRALGVETLRMRAIRARHWNEARRALAAPAATPATPDPTPSAWREQDRELVRRYDALPRKSPVLAAALSMVVPGLGRVYHRPLARRADELSPDRVDGGPRRARFLRRGTGIGARLDPGRHRRDCFMPAMSTGRRSARSFNDATPRTR